MHLYIDICKLAARQTDVETTLPYLLGKQYNNKKSPEIHTFLDQDSLHQPYQEYSRRSFYFF